MRIDAKRFWPSLIIILAVLTVVALKLEMIQSVVNGLYDFCIEQLGWFYVLSNLVALAFSFFIMLGPYKNVRLGGEDAKPAFSTFSWAAMMFTTSCGAWLIVYGFLEPIYCAAQAPFQIEPLSITAYEYGQAYAHFHWGPNAWCLYVPASVAISYLMYNRNGKSCTIGSACQAVLRGKREGIGAYVLDIFSIFGTIVAPVISLGTGMPLLVVLIQDLFGVQQMQSALIELAIMAVWILLFGTSVFLGLHRGIKRLSDINVTIGFAYMGVIAILAGLLHVIGAELNAVGLFATEYVRMSTYTDPYGTGSFVKGWTMSYWAVYFTYMPLMGVFNAKISKGRRLKEIAFGQLVLCSLGCWASMGTLGNYSFNLQRSGAVDVAGILSTQSEADAILAIVRNMPAPKVMMLVLLLLLFVFLATTMDSAAFAAAEMTSHMETSESLATRWNRIVWAIVACGITFVLLRVGGFRAVRLLAILTGIPLAVAMYLLIASFLKMIREDRILPEPQKANGDR